MDNKIIDLAQMMLDKVRKVPDIAGYLRVSADASSLSEIPLANLFYHLDKYYDEATVVKSALLFLIEDLGLNKQHCVLILAIEQPALCSFVASVIAENTEGYYIARAHSPEEVDQLTSYFRLNDWACGLIMEDPFCDQEIDPWLERCKGMPSCVLIDRVPTYRNLKLLSLGANVIVYIDGDESEVEDRLKIALYDMFLGEEL